MRASVHVEERVPFPNVRVDYTNGASLDAAQIQNRNICVKPVLDSESEGQVLGLPTVDALQH